MKWTPRSTVPHAVCDSPPPAARDVRRRRAILPPASASVNGARFLRQPSPARDIRLPLCSWGAIRRSQDDRRSDPNPPQYLSTDRRHEAGQLPLLCPATAYLRRNVQMTQRTLQ